MVHDCNIFICWQWERVHLTTEIGHWSSRQGNGNLYFEDCILFIICCFQVYGRVANNNYGSLSFPGIWDAFHQATESSNDTANTAKWAAVQHEIFRCARVITRASLVLQGKITWLSTALRLNSKYLYQLVIRSRIVWDRPLCYAGSGRGIWKCWVHMHIIVNEMPTHRSVHNLHEVSTFDNF